MSIMDQLVIPTKFQMNTSNNKEVTVGGGRGAIPPPPPTGQRTAKNSPAWIGLRHLITQLHA